MSQLVDHLPQDLIDALPALHAFTGSDYTASMMNKGKLKALELMMKSDISTHRHLLALEIVMSFILPI